MICPNCQKDEKITEQNHGALYTCTSCSAVYFINFDGEPVYGDNELPPEAMAEPALSEVDPPLSENLEASFDSQLDQVLSNNLDNLTDNFGVPDISENQFAPVDQPMAEPASYETPVEAAEAAPAYEEGLNNDFNMDFNSSLNPFETPAGTAPEMATPVREKSAFQDAANDISSFGNNEVQLAGLNYDLKITGLDTQETKKLFREAIEDLKFGWDTEELMRSIKNGEIRFERLNPVKAYILAKRLQFLDIEKQWNQNVLS